MPVLSCHLKLLQILSSMYIYDNYCCKETTSYLIFSAEINLIWYEIYSKNIFIIYFYFLRLMKPFWYLFLENTCVKHNLLFK